MSLIFSIIGFIPKIFGINKYYKIVKFCELLYKNKLKDIGKMLYKSIEPFDNIFYKIEPAIFEKEWNTIVLETNTVYLKIIDKHIYLIDKSISNEQHEKIIKDKKTIGKFKLLKYLILRSTKNNKDIEEFKIKQNIKENNNKIVMYMNMYS